MQRTIFTLMRGIGQSLLLYFIATVYAQGQVLVTQVKVLDKHDRGIKSTIFEVTRERKKLLVDDTDNNGVFNKHFKCQKWHKIFAKPLAGPFTDSDEVSCAPTVVLRVLNFNNFAEAPVRIIVPFAQGAPSDLLARAIAPILSERWRQATRVENVPGAAGNVGTELAATSSPNGYTLLLATSPIFTINPSIFKAPYDPLRSFVGVTMVASSPTVLIAAASLPGKSVKEVFEMARTRPEGIRLASVGTGTVSHLSAEQFKTLTGVKNPYVPYRNSAEVLASITNRTTQLSFVSLTAALPYIQSRDVKILAVTGNRRSTLLPDVPTLAEGGIPGYESNVWFGLFSPAGTPPSIIKKIYEDINVALRMPEVRNAFIKQGLEPIGNTPEQFALVIQHDAAKWNSVIKDAGIKPQ